MLGLLLQRGLYLKTDLNVYSRDTRKIAAVFSNSSTCWNFNTIYQNGLQLANGFESLQIIKDDVILVRLKQNLKERFLIRIAAAKQNAKVKISKASNLQELEQQFYDTKARAFVFNTYDDIGGTTVIDGLYRLMPQVLMFGSGSEIYPKNFRYLRSLIQVDNYKYSATIQYTTLLQKEMRDTFALDFTTQVQPIMYDKVLPPSRPILITDPCHELAFRAGILHSMVTGRTLLCSVPDQVKSFSAAHEHEIDVICTEPLTELHNNNRVIVERGSKLYLKHPRRIQIEEQL